MTEIHRPDIGPYEPFFVHEGVFVVPLPSPTLPPATHTNCVVLGGKQVVLVDPAAVAEDARMDLVAALGAEGREVTAVWLTHHHGDHVGAALFIAQRYGVPVRAHPATAARLDGLVSIDDPLLDGDIIELDGMEVEVLHTPGHARGHLAFRDRNRRTLVAGDLVAGQGTIVIDPPEGDMADYLVTLARLVEDGIGAVVPAHGPIMPDGELSILAVIAHRKAREEQVRAVLSRRLGRRARPMDLVAEVYPEVPGFWHPLAARQVLAHLLKLEGEGAAVREGPGGLGTPIYATGHWGPARDEPSFRLVP